MRSQLDATSIVLEPNEDPLENCSSLEGALDPLHSFESAVFEVVRLRRVKATIHNIRTAVQLAQTAEQNVLHWMRERKAEGKPTRRLVEAIQQAQQRLRQAHTEKRFQRRPVKQPPVEVIYIRRG